MNIFDFGQTREFYSLVMEYVDGMNLHQLAKTETVTSRRWKNLRVEGRIS